MVKKYTFHAQCRDSELFVFVFNSFCLWRHMKRFDVLIRWCKEEIFDFVKLLLSLKGILILNELRRFFKHFTKRLIYKTLLSANVINKISYLHISAIIRLGLKINLKLFDWQWTRFLIKKFRKKSLNFKSCSNVAAPSFEFKLSWTSSLNLLYNVYIENSFQNEVNIKFPLDKWKSS